MLARDVTVEGFSTTDWLRLGDLVRAPRGSRPRARRRRSGGVVALTTGDRLRKLVSTRRGRLSLEDETWPQPLESLAARHEAAWAARLHTGALEELMERLGARMQQEHDYLEQGLLMLSIARELIAEGAIEVWPWNPVSWPVPTAGVASRAFDALCPNGKVIAVGAFDAGEVYTCLALRRMGGGFDRVVGPEGMRPEMGLVSGDWSRDYRHLARAIEDQVGPLAVGCFAELGTYRRLAGDTTPGAWAAAVAARDVFLAPVSPAVVLPIGFDLGRAALATVRSVAERFGAQELLGASSPLTPAFQRMRKAALGDRDLPALLGFDPLEVLRALLARTRDSDE